ncbi:hypothetical protein LCGC14_0313440 [marine sediment metagenome]|uniref:Uncharacterized protein n=1 Tax=marine sediment metagenome TaxID=412755 RepID=A0A0F9U441_9ZZZZ
MAYITSEDITLTATTSTSPATASSSKTYNGYLHAVQLEVSTSTPLSTQGLLQITGDRTGLLLFSKADISADGQWFPRTVGVLSTASDTATTGAVADRLPLFNEKVTVTMTCGSTSGTTSGTLRLFVE